VGPRAGMDGQKISSPPGFDPVPSSPQSVAIPTELPGPLSKHGSCLIVLLNVADEDRLCVHPCYTHSLNSS